MTLDASYRRTASGDDALQSVDDAIPGDYRRILRLIEGNTHANVVRGRLRRYSDALIADWLAELEEIGFIETVAAETRGADFDLLLNGGMAAAAPDEIPDTQLDAEATLAGAALKDKGAYLAQARLENREPLLKEPSQTVVLIVEDDPDQAALGDLRVSMAGYSVRLARSCREMVADLTTHPLPDLVLLDVMLPDGNGFGLLSCMRTDPQMSLLPVIMLTALTGDANIRRGLNAGADGYITKPYSKDLLVGTIRQVLRQA